MGGGKGRATKKKELFMKAFVAGPALCIYNHSKSLHITADTFLFYNKFWSRFWWIFASQYLRIFCLRKVSPRAADSFARCFSSGNLGQGNNTPRGGCGSGISFPNPDPILGNDTDPTLTELLYVFLPSNQLYRQQG